MFHLSCVHFFLDFRGPESQDPDEPEWLGPTLVTSVAAPHMAHAQHHCCQVAAVASLSDFILCQKSVGDNTGRVLFTI